MHFISIQKQREWEKAFASERERISKNKTILNNLKKKLDTSKDDDEIAELNDAMKQLFENDVFFLNANLPSPSGWPCVVIKGDSVEEYGTGIPFQLGQIMLFNPPRKLFDCVDLMAFSMSAKDLPPIVSVALTSLVYESSSSEKKRKTPMDVMLGPAELMDAYEKTKRFNRTTNSLDAFCGKGCFSEKWMRHIVFVHNQIETRDRVELLVDYLQNSIRNMERIALDKRLLSDTIYFTTLYVEKGNLTVCDDLRKLLQDVLPEIHDSDFCAGNRNKSEWSNDFDDARPWIRGCTSTFLTGNFLFTILHQRYNDLFFKLTPQNLFIVNEIAVSHLAWQFGSDEWVQIGLPTVVMDAGMSFSYYENGEIYLDTRKSNTAGFDYGKAAQDDRRTSHRAYFQLGEVDDGQKFVQLRQFTPHGILIGYVLFSNGKIIQSPNNELGTPLFLSEGPMDDQNTINTLVNCIPRDDDTNSELYTTLDLQQNNARSQGFKKLIPGWSAWICASGTNSFLGKAAQRRVYHLYIACNIVYSSGPPDIEGLNRHLEEANPIFLAEISADQMHVTRPVVGTGTGNDAGNKKRGNRPTDEARKQWAPFLYFVPSVCGASLGIANKLGFWKMGINYHVKAICSYMYHMFFEKLKGFVMSINEGNVSRYHDSAICREVSFTAQIETMLAMLACPNLNDAKVLAMMRLCHNAVNIATLPKMYHKFLQRIVRFDVFLCSATIGLYVDVPVIPLHSLLLFFDGRADSMPQADKEVLKSFLIKCHEQRMFMNEDSFSGDGRAYMSKPIPFITSGGDWESSESILRDRVQMGTNEKKGAKEVFNIVVRKLWERNKHVLITCAFVKDMFAFSHAMKVMIDQKFDLRPFFGGMSMFKKTRSLFESLGLESIGRNFENEICEDLNTLTVGRTSFEIYCIGISLWDVLLFSSVCQRPRRSVDMWDDIADTFVVHAFNTLPRAIFPFPTTMYNKEDSITKKNRLCRLDEKRSHAFIIRPRNQEIFSRNFQVQYPGKTLSRLLEDEAHMTHLLEICSFFKITNYLDFPLDVWPFSLNVQRGVVYPFVRYKNTNVAEWARDYNIRADATEIYVFPNPSTVSLQVFSATNTEVEINENMCNFEWSVNIRKICDFMPGKNSRHAINSFDEAMSLVCNLGFGPIPIYQRPSVCIPVGNGNKVFGVVPHSRNKGKCKNNHTRCFYCIYEPFYHLKCGETYRRARAQFLREHVLPIGATLYLDIQSQEFRSVVDYSDQNDVQSGRETGGDDVIFDEYGVPFMVNEGGDGSRINQFSRTSQKFLEVRLDTPRNYTSQDKIYVSFLCQERSNISPNTNSIYISPEHLRTSLNSDMNETKISVIYKA